MSDPDKPGLVRVGVYGTLRLIVQGLVEMDKVWVVNFLTPVTPTVKGEVMDLEGGLVMVNQMKEV